MSELMIKQHGGFRRQLLTTVSALALIGSACGAHAADNDSDRPQVWIELGGQLERTSGAPEIFSPSFFSNAAAASLDALTKGQELARYSLDTEGKLTFEPEGSDWVLSAAIRYGRTDGARHLHHQTAYATRFTTLHGFRLIPRAAEPFGDDQSQLGQSHLLLDFQVGKDIGLGWFGAHGNSVLSAGVRFAQFSSSSNVTLHARQGLHYASFGQPGKYTIQEGSFHNYNATSLARRSVRAVGPSISWDGTLPFAGNSSDTTLNFDWGVNAAVLFGRQRAKVHHQTSGSFYKGVAAINEVSSYVGTPVDRSQSRSLTIPNVGGFAGISFRYADAKISIGYRGDFFFGAMDTGIDARKSTTLGFFGPFASISIGLGD